MSRRLFRAALRCVPRDWRGAVERDLVEEGHRSDVRLAASAFGIAMRLRLARTLDGLSHPRAWRIRRIRFMRDFTRDVRFAVRGALRRPAYALAIIATLAVGIGANTAIYSVFNWILFRPIPGVDRPGELVTVKFLHPQLDGRYFVSYRDAADLRGIGALSGLTASAAQSMNVVLSPGAEPERIEGEIVMADYFDVLGVRLREGRPFVGGEERPGEHAPAAIISDALRRRAFGGTSHPIGRQIWINGHAFSIVGVAPPGFHGRTLVAAAHLWVPTGAHPYVMPTRPALLTDRRATLFLEAVGRLRPGATIAQVQDQARAIARAVADFGGRSPGSARAGIAPTVVPGVGLDQSATERLATMWRLLAVAVGLVLLLACANAANLLLARALGRQRETAVQQAIGASRFRLIRQQLAEGLVLALAAGAGGLVLAMGLVWAFDGMRIVSYLPALEGVRLDGRVVTFALLIAMATAVLCSIAPAIAASRVDLQATLKDGRTSSRRSGRLRASLVVVQVAVSVLLVVSAGLFARTLHNLRALDLGVTLDGVVTFSADPTRVGLETERAHAYFTGMLERLRSAPGIVSAAYVFSPPYSNILSDTAFRRAGSPDQTEHDAENTHVSPGYFATLGIPLLAGRDFTEADFRQTSDATADVVIVSERLAREVFPEGGAVGSQLILSYPKGKVVEIVGVAGNVRRRPITNEPAPFIYSPSLGTWGTVAVRSSLPFAQTAAVIRSVAREMNASLPPYDVEPMGSGLDRVLSEQRLLARFSVLFATVAALLAAVGIYGMLACAVGERMREFGIRLALGARAPSLLRQVLYSAVRITSIGIAIGLAAAYLTTRALEARLFGLTHSDPSTLIATCAVLLAIAVLASVGPAVRATRADPIRAIRSE